MFPRLWATSLFHVKHDRTVCGCRCPNCRRASPSEALEGFLRYGPSSSLGICACRIRDRWTTSIINDWGGIYRRSLSFRGRDLLFT